MATNLEVNQRSVDATIAANMRAEITRAEVARTDVARVLAISPQALSRKLRGLARFSAAELVAVAAYLGVAVGTLTDGAALAAEQAGAPA